MAKGKTLSMGLTCDECGLWPMPDPFYAVIDDDNEVVKYICTKCAEKPAS